MHLLDPDSFKLYGDHFICNIVLDENLPGGLISVNRDPRKRRKKLDAYVARVERIGPSCKSIKPGDKIVVERFDWLQYDLDDERIIARETDVLILASDIPAKGVFVLKEINALQEKAEKSSLYIPEEGFISKMEREIYFGKVIFSNEAKLNSEVIESGQFIWVRKSERNQFRLGKDLIVIRATEEDVLMIGSNQEPKKKIQLEVA